MSPALSSNGLAPNGGIFSWDGTSWTLQQFSSAYELWGVTAISAADAWTVDYSSNNSTLALHWNGTTWQDESPVNQTVNLQDVGGATQPRARLEELLQVAASPASGYPREALTSRDVSRGPTLPPLPSGRRAA